MDSSIAAAKAAHKRIGSGRRASNESAETSLASIAGKYEGDDWNELRSIIEENRRLIDAMEPERD